jgi:hypothetical protein
MLNGLGQKRWVQELLALCLALLVVSALFTVGLLLAGILALFGTLALWVVQSRRDQRSYGASPGALGVPWQCDLCGGRRFPDRQSALDHAGAEHPEADAREHVRIASGMAAEGR